MSNTETTKPGPVITIADPAEETQVVEKQSFIQKRIVSPIKNHPKVTAIAVAGVALVGGAFVLGRKTADDDSEPLALESAEVYDDGTILAELVDDTTVA